MTNNAGEKQTLGFQAEVKQLLNLVTHALYSNKEIFLRELISNASDAEDKLRFEAVSNPKLYENDSELKIWIDYDKDKKTLTIRDNGIGMSRQEVIDNLGTIARSGTREFLAALGKAKAKDTQLIGQFGVGFYSSFIVADKVCVETRRAGVMAKDGVRWESSGEGDYTLESIHREQRGTTITLHIKDDESEFLDRWRLQQIITKYSDHIAFPVLMEEWQSEEDKKAEKPIEYKPVNKAKALWAQSKSEITDEEYKEFYKHISHDFEEPLTWAHNRVEGKQEYISLLYLPKAAPFDLWNRDTPRGLKLYVQRVFIMDNAEQLLPLYLRFVKGVIDSNDLPLNISRELLQNNKVIESIRAATTKRVLDMLEKMAADDKEVYQNFWKAFGPVLKEGMAEDVANRDRLVKLLRFSTTFDDKEAQAISLEDYVARMQPEQDKIYYITADGFNAAMHSPHLEIFRKKGIEVLLLHDRVDEWLIAHLHEYEGKSFVSVTRGDLDLGKLDDEMEQERQKQTEEEFASILDKVKKVLEAKTKDVRMTHRLTNSPACIVADEQDLGMNIQRILKAAGQEVPDSKPILELNPDHPLVKKLQSESNETRFTDLSHVLFDQAVLAEGGTLTDPAIFVQRMNQLFIDME
jgi:molecular chaperone HtpG